MIFKKDDLLILNDLGIKFMSRKENSKTKKNETTLYRMKIQKGERFIILESVDKTRNLGVWRADFFQLATPMQIKIFTIGEIFS